MRATLTAALVWLLAAGAARGAVKTEVSSSGPSVGEVAAYTGPKARIAVASFDTKAAQASMEIGRGLADMLVDALFRTGRFIVLEKGDTMDALKEEFALGEEGWAKKAPAKGSFESADIVVTGAITAFEPEYKGSGGAGLVVPLPWKLGGGVRIRKNEAYIAATIRLADVRTRRIVNSTRVEGLASDFKVGAVGGALVGSVVLGAAFEKYKNTPMEKAVMVMIDKAVDEIAGKVPEEYYRAGTPAPGAPAGKAGDDEIVGGSSSFRPGASVLLQESFAGAQPGDAPKGWTVKDGPVEIARFRQRNWLRFLGSGSVSRQVKGGTDFSLSFDLHAPGSSVVTLSAGGAELIRLAGSAVSVRGLEAATGVARTAPLTFAVSRKGDLLAVFLNGVRIHEARLGPKDARPALAEIRFAASGIDTAARSECLVGGVAAAAYE